MKIFRISLFTILALSSWAAASAQDTTSPYSKFGYGLLRDHATSSQRAMGGVGYAMNSGRQINVMNPASYASIDTLTFLFDTGVSLVNLWSEDDGVRRKTTGGGLDYVTMQFPLGKRMGGSFGLVPYSSVGYSFGSEIDNGVSLRSGDGGLNLLYLGVSGRIVKGLSLGANIAYFFGTTTNSVFATSSLGSVSLFSQSMEVRDWYLDLGVQYTRDIDADNRVCLGVTYSPGKTLLGHTMVTTAEVGSSTTNVLDTVAYTSLKDKFSIASTLGVGVNYQWKKRLMVEADLTWQNWGKAKFPTMDNFLSTTFQDRWRVGLGAQYTHAQRGNYFGRINYRAGLFFERDYIKVASNSVKQWGASIGFGLPAPSGKTTINLGLQYVNRRAYPDALLKEDYLTVTLGVNFNEVWFWQNKIR